MLDLLLVTTFLVSAAYAILLVWRKIPLLLQVPSQLIQESFVTRPSHLKNYLDPLVDFFREDKFRDFYYSVLIRTLSALRLGLLRWERKIFRWLEVAQGRSHEWTERDNGYLSELKQWKQAVRENGNALPQAVLKPETPPEVRAKRPTKINKAV